jgi:hypothetical protein
MSKVTGAIKLMDCLNDFWGPNDKFFDTGKRPIASNDGIIVNDELGDLSKVLSQLCLEKLGKTLPETSQRETASGKY